MENPTEPIDMNEQKIQRNETIMVCITNQYSCERLILFAKNLCEARNANLLVTSVLPYKQTNMPEVSKELDHLFLLSTQAGADLSILYSDSPINALTKLALLRKVDFVVTGTSKNRTIGKFHEDLGNALLRTPLLIIDPEGKQLYKSKNEGKRVQSLKPVVVT